ncbi:MAG: lactate racemase domain-containing protein [bacterium]
MIVGIGSKDRFLSEEKLTELCREALRKKDFRSKKVLVIIPDATRSGPTDLFFKTICGRLSRQAQKLDFMIALGTHPPMNEEKVNRLLGISSQEKKTKYRDIDVFQHHWDRPEELQRIGTISREEIRKISHQLMDKEISVEINKKIFHYDELLIVGPVFPHEVVGFSGGYKYLFPGIAGPEILHRFHWLGALITNPKINGVKDTPIRKVINRATGSVDIPITQFCFVVKEKKVFGFYAGGEEAWSKASDLSSQLNIKWVDKAFHTVLSVAPRMYEDMWTAGKCMYKLEPVVEDRGMLIIYAPHIKEVSYTHGECLEKIGYHTRDYFLKQSHKFKHIPGAILAHSTHVKGIGTYRNGKEMPRIKVVLATRISKEKCKRINLGYLDPAQIRVEDYAGKEKEGILLVRNAGEVLYRLSSGKVPNVDEL